MFLPFFGQNIRFVFSPSLL